MEKLLIKRTDEAKRFDLPRPKKVGDCGIDLCTVRNTILPCNSVLPIDVPTGIKVKIPQGMLALILNRSGVPRQMGIDVVPGVIDEGYVGELFACCFNRTGRDIFIPSGTRLVQLILLPASILNVEIEEVDELPETQRGESGFGSSGK